MKVVIYTVCDVYWASLPINASVFYSSFKILMLKPLFYMDKLSPIFTNLHIPYCVVPSSVSVALKKSKRTFKISAEKRKKSFLCIFRSSLELIELQFLNADVSFVVDGERCWR